VLDWAIAHDVSTNAAKFLCAGRCNLLRFAQTTLAGNGADGRIWYREEDRMSGRAVRRTRFALCALLSLLVWQPGLAAEDIVIGNIASLTNPTSKQNSTNLTLGYQVYFEHINRQGGIHGRKIQLLNKDDGVTAEKMVSLTDELIADPRIVALAGFLNTAGLSELVKNNVPGQKKIALIAPVGSMNAPNFYPLRAGYTDEVEKLLRETQDTQKKRVALVYYNQAFGPSIFKFAQDWTKKNGVNVVATGSFETTPDKMEAGIAAAAATLSKADPDAVIIIAAGAGAYNFVKKFREGESKFAQLYTLSPADSLLMVKLAGLENAQGVVISQAVPYPQHNAVAVVREYQKLMKLYAPPGHLLAFYSLEGFMGAKLVVEALKRAGPNPTREKVITALNTMKDFDLGDFHVSYTPTERRGSKFVDLTIIGKNGTLYR
jgi:branched-chain amino acid transport system substrate-binding protein